MLYLLWSERLEKSRNRAALLNYSVFSAHASQNSGNFLPPTEDSHCLKYCKKSIKFLLAKAQTTDHQINFISWLFLQRGPKLKARNSK